MDPRAVCRSPGGSPCWYSAGCWRDGARPRSAEWRARSARPHCRTPARMTIPSEITYIVKTYLINMPSLHYKLYNNNCFRIMFIYFIHCLSPKYTPLRCYRVVKSMGHAVRGNTTKQP